MVIDTKKILSNKWLRYALVLGIGVAIGAIFYPSKDIERETEKRYERKIEKIKSEKESVEKKYKEKLRVLESEKKTYREEMSRKISTVKREKSRLERKVKERKLKIVKPDGTVVEKTFRESETEAITSTVTKIREEFDRKVSSIEEKWKKIHRDRISKVKSKYESKLKLKDSEIKTLKKRESISVNDRNFGVSFGVNTDSSYYSSVSYDVFGPVFVDALVQPNFSSISEGSLGVGVGLRF